MITLVLDRKHIINILELIGRATVRGVEARAVVELQLKLEDALNVHNNPTNEKG